MVDTGAAITLMKKWADAHGFPVKEKAAKYISGANGTAVKIIGTTRLYCWRPPWRLMWQTLLFALVTSNRGCLDVICFAGIMRLLVLPLSLCLGWANKVLLFGYRRRWAVLQSPEWSRKTLLRH